MPQAPAARMQLRTERVHRRMHRMLPHRARITVLPRGTHHAQRHQARVKVQLRAVILPVRPARVRARALRPPTAPHTSGGVRLLRRVQPQRRAPNRGVLARRSRAGLPARRALLSKRGEPLCSSRTVRRGRGKPQRASGILRRSNHGLLRKLACSPCILTRARRRALRALSMATHIARRGAGRVGGRHRARARRVPVPSSRACSSAWASC